MASRVVVALALLCVLCSVSFAYDPSVALRGVYYSAATYCSPQSVSQWSCGTPCSELPGVSPSGATMLEFSQNTDTAATFGFVTYNSNYNEIVVAFRGTDGLHMNSESFANWITNLDATQVAYSASTASGATPMVHQGFYTAYQGVQAQVMQELNNLASTYPDARILVTGHSLGAALASFAAMDILLNYQPSSSSEFIFYTFGCPRVGDSNWVELFNENIPSGASWRVVHYYDLVPHVPMEIQGYEHVEPEVWYNEPSTSYQISQTSIPSYGDSVADHVDYLNVMLTAICATPYGAEDDVFKAIVEGSSSNNNNNNNNNHKGNSNKTAIIVGSVIGGVAFVAVVALVVALVVRKRRITASNGSTGTYHQMSAATAHASSQDLLGGAQ